MIHLDDGVRPTDILDSEAGVPARSLALDERRDLRVSPQPSSAHLEDGLLVLGVLQGGGAPVVSAALDTVSCHLAQIKLPQVVTRGAQKLGRVKASLKTLGSAELVIGLDNGPVKHEHQLADQSGGQPVHGEPGN